MQSATSPIDIPHEEPSAHFIVHDGDNNETHIDLNDHRLQPSSMPRSEGISPRPRRGTLASIYDGQPDLLRVDQALVNSEQAIEEDDNTSLSGVSPRDKRPMFGRRGSTSPVLNRRNTARRQQPNLSRESSSSRSSSSAPNSVHAFAEGYRRRQRAGTVNSKAASSVDLPLKRMTSHGSYTRRPTFSGRDDESDSGHSSAEEDVCYPGSEPRNSDTYSIAYSELDELVEEQELERAKEIEEVNPTTPKVTVDLSAPGRHLPYPTPSEEDFIELEKHKICRQTTSASEPPRASRQNLEKRSWTFFSSELDDVILSSSIGGLLEEGETFQHLFQLPSDREGCWWLDALNATEDEVAALCKAFGVHSLTREDIVTKDPREKIELFKTYYFVSLQSFYQNKTDEDYLDPVSHYAIVFKQGLLTFSTHQGPHTKNMLQRIGRLRDYLNLNADWVCYALIDDIVDSFMPVIRDIEKEVDTIEDDIFVARDEDARPLLRNIAESRKKSMSLLRLLGNKPDVIKGFAKRCNEGYAAAPSTNVGLYLSDIQDHILTYRDNLTHSEQLLSRLHNNFLAQLNVEHIASGNKVNKLLGKVTLVATILVPLNLVTGLFGMNVPVPGKNANSLGWFFGILGIIFGFILVALTIAKRMKFI
jgi:magnesium transporter